MLTISRLSIALVAAISVADATRTTLNDYVVLKTAIYNPPACGVSYASLNVNKITALSGISGNYDSNCGACIQVCGSAGCDHLLVVDSCVGPDHLDISTTAGPNIVGSDTGVHEATYTFVDSSNCAGIWDGTGLDAVVDPPKNWEVLKNGGGSPAPAPAPAAPVNEQSYDYNYEAPAPVTPSPAPEVPQEQPQAPPEQPVSYPDPTTAPVVPAPPVVETPSPTPSPAPVETPVAPPAPSTTVVPEVNTPTTPSAVPGDFYEDATSVPVESYGAPNTPSPIPTPPVVSPAQSSTTVHEILPTETPVPSIAQTTLTPGLPSDVESSATPSPTTLTTIRPVTFPSVSSVVIPPSVIATPATPTQTPPPVFTGAATRSSALPVLAGSMFGVALAFFI